MVTAASRRLATVVLGGVVLVPSGLLLAAPALADDPAGATPTVVIGEPAYAEATPDPVTGLYPGQAAPATGDLPATGGWIIGGTLQEAAPAGPKAVQPKPVAPKPTVAKPVTVQAPAARPVTVRQRTTTRVQRPASVTRPGDVPTVLPFTGPGRLEGQLGAGAALVVLGALVLVVARPQDRALHAR